MAFCDVGEHDTGTSYKWGGRGFCLPDHPAPHGPVDPKVPGSCAFARPHIASSTYWIPVMGQRICTRHLKVYIAEIIRRGEWGRA